MCLLVSCKKNAINTQSSKNNNNNMSETTFNIVHYAFQDASKAPKYHRSYKIIVKEKEIIFEVTSYSKSLHKKKHKITEEQYNNILALSKNIEAPASKVAEGATGTSSQRIDLKTGNNIIHSLSWDSLSTVNDDTEKCVTAIKALVPDLETAIKVED